MRNVGRKLGFRARRLQSRHDDRQPLRLPHERAGRGYRRRLPAPRSGRFDPVEVELALQLIEARRRFTATAWWRSTAAPISACTRSNGRPRMTGWGSVIAIEAQERIYHALAGNIAINNCFNAIAMHAAVAAEPGVMHDPEARLSRRRELRQPRAEASAPTPSSSASRSTIPTKDGRHRSKISLDALALPRVDLIKLDIEGMELEALEGARGPIAQSQADRAGRADQGRARAAARLSRAARLQDRRCRHESAGHSQERSGASELQMPDLPRAILGQPDRALLHRRRRSRSAPADSLRARAPQESPRHARRRASRP